MVIRGKDLILLSFLTTLIWLSYIFTMHTPTATLVQNSVAGLSKFVVKNVDGDETDSQSEQRGISINESEKISFEVETLSGTANETAMGNETSIQQEFPGLVDILKKAALPNNTLLITALNSAWALEDSMVDLFLGSFHAGEGISHYLDHFLIIALDQPSYVRCLQIHHICFRLETEGVDFAAEKFFMSGDYLKMMWRRVEFLGIVLDLGYSLLFSDADIMWFRDPFPHFSPDADFQIACDHFNGDPTDMNNLPNGGFVYVRSNERTVEFYKFWFESRLAHPHKHDQDVFNSIKRTRQFAGYHLKVEFLDTKFFGGFCEVSPDLSQVCTMHANCCTGLERKLLDLKLTIADWSQYRAMTPKEQREQRVFWQAPKECLNSDL